VAYRSLRMRLHAVVLHGTGGATHEFTPDGEGGWVLETLGPHGSSPGGRWSSEEVARHVVDAILDTQPASMGLA
jgi:hypothetical protein